MRDAECGGYAKCEVEKEKSKTAFERFKEDTISFKAGTFKVEQDITSEGRDKEDNI